MGRRALLVLLFYAVIVGALFAIVYAIGFFHNDNNQAIVSALLAVAVPVIVGSGRLILGTYRQPVREWLTTSVLRQSVYRMCLYGQKGSGKTTLVKSIVLSGSLPKEKSTQSFDTYTQSINVERVGRIVSTRIMIADYRGEKPSQVVVDMPQEFTRSGQSAMNGILFVVDLAPRLYDQEGNQLSNEKVLEWLCDDPLTKIRNRVQQHHEYISKYTIEILFRTLFSENLKSVRLVINKIDLVQELVAKNLLEGVDATRINEFVLSLFRDISENLRAACQENDVPDFGIVVVSATQDLGMRALISGLVEQFTAGTSQGMEWKHEPRTAS